MSAKAITIVVLCIIVLAGIIWYVSGSSTTQPPAPETQNVVTTSTATSTTGEAMVNYTSTGFSPSTVTIADDQTVMWMNESSEPLWVASNPHPTHQGYDGTTRAQHCAPGYTGAAPFDECTDIPPGGSWSFTFNRVGSWGYHNHSDPSMMGTVTVTAAAATASTTGSASVSI